GWIRAPGVGEDLEALLSRLRERRLEPGLDVLDIALVRVLGLLALEDRKRQLGEMVETKVVDLSLVRELDRRPEKVTPVGAAGAEPNLLHTGITPLRRFGGGTSLRE